MFKNNFMKPNANEDESFTDIQNPLNDSSRVGLVAAKAKDTSKSANNKYDLSKLANSEAN